MPAAPKYAKIFSVDRVYFSAEARFVRLVGMLPIVGVVAPDKIGERTLGLHGRWRRRVLDLTKWGVYPVDGVADGKTRRAKWRMFDCRPAFAVCAPVTKHCRVDSLCPSCWARSAADVWRPRDRALFGEPAGVVSGAAPGDVVSRALSYDDDEVPSVAEPRRHDLAMIVRSNTYKFDSLGKFLDFRLCQGFKFRRTRGRFTSRPAEIVRLRRAGVLCGLDATHVGVHYDRTRAGDGRGERLPFDAWDIECNQVLFCRADDADEIMDNQALAKPETGVPNSGFKKTLTRDPSRYDFMRATAHALRYSRFLMTGTRDEVETYLAARKGRRLVAAFGDFPVQPT